MAGLQFYFFPTDFYYPRPNQAINDESTSKLVQVQNQNRPRINDGDQVVVQRKDKLLQALSSTSRPSTVIIRTKMDVNKTNPFASDSTRQD